MDPNNSQPTGPQNPNVGPGQPPAPLPPASSAVPDWQQGLGNIGQQPPVQPGPVGGGVPVNQPAAWQNQGMPGVPSAGSSPMGPDMNSSFSSSPPRRGLPRMVIVILVVIGVLLLVMVTYFVFFKDGDSSTDAANKSNNSANGTDLSSVRSVTLHVPDTISGYEARDTGVESIKDFIAEDGSCELIVGTVAASQLPGKDLNEIVDPQLKQLRDAGATIQGPSAGPALILKEAGGDGTYHMPTITFEFSQDTRHATVHYSAVILAGSERAVVNRTCANKDGAVDTAKLRALDDIAKRITVTVKK